MKKIIYPIQFVYFVEEIFHGQYLNILFHDYLIVDLNFHIHPKKEKYG